MFLVDAYRYSSVVKDEEQASSSITWLPAIVQLPLGSVQVLIKNVKVIIIPLPSLIVSYKVLDMSTSPIDTVMQPHPL